MFRNSHNSILRLTTAEFVNFGCRTLILWEKHKIVLYLNLKIMWSNISVIEWLIRNFASLFLTIKLIFNISRVFFYIFTVFFSLHRPFKLPPGGFKYYSGFSACLHSIWTSWIRIQLQRNLSCSAFWKKSKIDNFSSYLVVRIFRVVRRSF